MRPSLLPNPYCWAYYSSWIVCPFFYFIVIVMIIILTALSAQISDVAIAIIKPEPFKLPFIRPKVIITRIVCIGFKIFSKKRTSPDSYWLALHYTSILRWDNRCPRQDSVLNICYRTASSRSSSNEANPIVVGV